MRIAYFNANLKVGQDGVTRVIYKMIDGALARNHEAIAITSILPEPSEQPIPMYKVPSVIMPLQKAYRHCYSRISIICQNTRTNFNLIFFISIVHAHSDLEQ